MIDMSESFMVAKKMRYFEGIMNNCTTLDRCIGSIDGTLIGISRPTNHEEQNSAYNGHKRLWYTSIPIPHSTDRLLSQLIDGRRVPTKFAAKIEERSVEFI